MLVAPGDLYGEKSSEHVRIALVQPDHLMNLAVKRLASSDHPNLRRI
jgi:aspartate/methionine/tyrosine aminotransferase